MRLLRQLWRLEGTVGRAQYAGVGVAAFALKYAIDWTLARAFGIAWTPLSYWRAIVPDVRVPATSMFVLMLLLAVPFLWLGMAMTLLRLRDAGRSAGWAALFFVPVLNVVLFAMLSVVPPRPRAELPDLSGALESALFAVLTTVGVAVAAIGLSTRLRIYGVGLFIAVPFCVGYLSAFLHTRRRPDSPVGAYGIAALSIALLGGFLMALLWEGMLCLLMSAPLALVIASIGAYLGRESALLRPRSDRTAFMAVALLPLAIVGEAQLQREAPVFAVSTDIVVNAPIERVWRNVVEFSDIAESPEWYFRGGIAYPLRARIDGRGAGATRYCEFTTGAFVEPIEVWDEPRLLRFGVTSNPPPMHELSPFGTVDAPHLHGFLVSKRGQFALASLSGGRTRVTGTTWYQHHLWPASYWTLWSDAIIHRIHLRVLRHVKALSERQSVAAVPARPAPRT